MKKTIITLLFVVAIIMMSLPVFAEPFADLVQDHWAYDAVNMLQQKGLVEGYPDGLFKGDRAMTRYEMAMVVARVIAKLEQVEASIPKPVDLTPYATKQDLEAVNKLVNEFKNELDALGVRVNNIEDSLGKLTARVDELERVKISGNFETIAAGVGLSKANDIQLNGGPGSIAGGSVIGADDPYLNYYVPTNPGTGDPSTFVGQNPVAGGRGVGYNNPTFFQLNQGYAVSSRLDLNVTAKISDSVKAGGTLVAYNAFGDAGVYNNWGVMAPLNSVGSIASGGPTNKLNFQANLSTLWFKSDSKNWNITGKYGSFNLQNVSSNLFYGVANPYFGYSKDRADVLPLYGFDFAGRLYDTVNVEVFMAQDVNWYGNNDRELLSSPLDAQTPGVLGTGRLGPAFRNYLFGGWAGYDGMDNKLHIEGSIMRLWEDTTSAPGATRLYTSAGSTLTLGGQDQMMFGFKASYKMMDKLSIYGEFAGSSYRPNLPLNNAGSTLPSGQSYKGYLFQIGGKGSLLDNKLDVYGEYVRTEVNFDPMGFHKTWDRGYNDGFHNSWDDMTGFGNAIRPGKFRSNRHGFDGGATYKLTAGEVFGRFTYLQQLTAGYDSVTDPVKTFFYGLDAVPAFAAYNSPINEGAKGKEMFVTVGGKYDFGGNLHVFGDWNYLKFKRDALAITGGNVDFSEHFIHLGVTYDVNDKFSVQGNLGYVKASNALVTNSGASTMIPGFGLRYEFNDVTSLSMDYHYYRYRVDDVIKTSEYNANRIITRLNVKF